MEKACEESDINPQASGADGQRKTGHKKTMGRDLVAGGCKSGVEKRSRRMPLPVKERRQNDQSDPQQ